MFGGVSILVFRGTDNRENVKTDVDIRMHHDKDLGTLLHMGFRNASHIIYSDIKRNYKLRKTVYLTGHSLGGAIAQIIGLWFHEEGYNVQIYTFGSPKVATTFLEIDPFISVLLFGMILCLFFLVFLFFIPAFI